MKFKKALALCLTLVLCATCLAGCGEKNFDSVVTIDGTAITPGTYRLYQSIAYTEAARSVADASADLFSQKLEEKSVSDWIYDRTVSLLQSYLFFQREFDRLGLTFTEEELADINATVDSEWDTVSAIYAKNGVTKEDFREYDVNSFKVQRVFTEACKDLTDDDIKAYLDENFALITYTQLPLIDSTGTPLAEDKAEKIGKIATDALAAVKDGDSYLEAAVPAITAAYAEAGFDIADYGAENFVMSTYLTLGNTDGENPLGAEVAKTAIDATGLYKSESQFYMLFQRLENYTTEEEFEALRITVLMKMRSADYTAETRPIYEAYEVVADKAAVKYYDPRKLDLSEPAPASSGASSAPASSAASSEAASSEAASSSAASSNS